MEVRSQKDKQQLSSNDSSTFSCRSLKLGVYSKSRLKSNSSTSSKNNPSSKCNMISSINRKIKINNIEVLSKSNQKRLSDPYYSKNDMTFSCFPESTSMRPTITFQNYLQFNQLQKKANSHQSLILQNIHNLRGQKLACFDENCQIKRKWIRSILFYEKQLKNLYLLKQRRGQLEPEIAGQIEKDVTRTYSKNVVYNTKINLIQNEVDKYNLIDILRNVLKLYAAYDQEVGYVQGMNLLAAPIVFHMKEVNAAFIYLKEVMNYGKLRLFYVENFDNIKRELKQRFKKLLRFYNAQLFDYFEQQEIDYTIFVPYYFSLFASLIDIQYMHIVINQFMRAGISFLHKLLLTLLLYLKNRILQDKEGEGVMMKLGTSYLKSLHINWKQIIHATQLISLP